MIRLVASIAACLALSVSTAASADSVANMGNTPVLQSQNGGVTTSTGGAFGPAATGKALAATERLMVAEGSSATVVYDNGCKFVYDKPGVYEIPKQCDLAASMVGSTSTASSGMSVVPVLVVGAVGAAMLLEAKSESDTPPISR